jgi:PilZ domain
VSRIWDALKQAENERSRSKGRKQNEHPHSDGADRRRSNRWEQPVPVLVYGSDSEKQPFHEETETADINDDGCSFTIATVVVKGQRLFLVNMLNEAERECRVVQAGQRPRGKAHVAVEFSGAAPDFWLPRKY